ncbi:hypothetical protein [Sphingomonas sp.]|uniref:hypothetical protein n=1 Tax=Sphingomonas sp. TaxID=28214 RepID=UPI003752C7B0
MIGLATALLAELGVELGGDNDITDLRHVQSRDERRATEEIASHTRCDDFEKFEPLFNQVQADLASGARNTRPFGKDASTSQGSFFILRGQLAYVAEVGETIKAPNGQLELLPVLWTRG